VGGVAANVETAARALDLLKAGAGSTLLNSHPSDEYGPSAHPVQSELVGLSQGMSGLGLYAPESPAGPPQGDPAAAYTAYAPTDNTAHVPANPASQYLAAAPWPTPASLPTHGVLGSGTDLAGATDFNPGIGFGGASDPGRDGYGVDNPVAGSSVYGMSYPAPAAAYSHSTLPHAPGGTAGRTPGSSQAPARQTPASLHQPRKPAAQR
jgi:hypothetical protein